MIQQNDADVLLPTLDIKEANFQQCCLLCHNVGKRRSVVVSGVGLINEVNRHRARLVLGWVTVCGRVNHLGM